jgi:hypothetical protein
MNTAFVEVLEEWASRSNMAINHSKCGVMVLGGPAPPNEQLFSFPKVARYKYLGFTVTPDLALSAHAKAVEGKLTFLRALLAPVLRRGRARFNVSLYRTLALPLYRLAFPLYDLAYSDDQDAFRVSIRKQARSFLAIPPTTPNRIVEGLLGDLGPMAMGVCEAADSLLDSRTSRSPPNFRLLRTLAEPARTRYLPDCTLLTLRTTYGRKC